MEYQNQSQELFYVILSNREDPQLARGKEQLISLLYNFKHPKIVTFEDEAKATMHLKALLELQGKKMPERQREPVESSLPLKKVKQEESPNLFNQTEVKTFSKNQLPSSLEVPRVVEDRRKKSAEEERKAIEPPQPENEIYSCFKEDPKKLALVKYHIKHGDKYRMNFDGASKANPGIAGAGYVIYDANRVKVYSNSLNLGIKTNNQAEYCGMIFGLRSAVNLGIKKLEVVGDSQLVLFQMKGDYKVKTEGLKPYYNEAKALEKKFEEISYQWVRREANTEADELSNEGVRAGSR